MKALATQRLLIRNFCPEDADALRETIVLYTASPYAVYDHAWPTSPESIKNIVQWFAGGDGFLAVCLKENGTFLGFIALNRSENQECCEYELGYVFSPLFAGHGYATEGCKALLNYAFDTLGCERVSSHTALLNQASCRLLSRLGFQKTGEDRASFQQDVNGRRIEFTALTFHLAREG
jgi:[ribosomal protein S5]-alanine N-acetyltransferase